MAALTSFGWGRLAERGIAIRLTTGLVFLLCLFLGVVEFFLLKALDGSQR